MDSCDIEAYVDLIKSSIDTNSVVFGDPQSLAYVMT